MDSLQPQCTSCLFYNEAVRGVASFVYRDYQIRDASRQAVQHCKETIVKSEDVKQNAIGNKN